MALSLLAKLGAGLKTAKTGAQALGGATKSATVTKFATTEGGMFARGLTAAKAGAKSIPNTWTNVLTGPQREALLATGGAAGIALT